MPYAPATPAPAPGARVPEVSRFYGIIITMFYNDHQPPHFHVRYGEHHAILGIDPLRTLAGSMPPRALGLAVEWASIHQAELRDNWQRAREHAPLMAIPPLA